MTSLPEDVHFQGHSMQPNTWNFSYDMRDWIFVPSWRDLLNVTHRKSLGKLAAFAQDREEMKIPTQACKILIWAKSDHVHAHTPVHILDYHLICTGSWEISIAWLQLSHGGSGYPATTTSKAFTKGTSPRQNNTHNHIVLRRLLTLQSGHHAELNVDTLWKRCTVTNTWWENWASCGKTCTQEMQNSDVTGLTKKHKL